MLEIIYKAKRIGLGLLTMIAVLIVEDLIPNPYGAYASPDAFFYFAFWPSVWGAFEVGLATCAGAYVARINFAGSAAIFAIVFGLLIVLMLQSIAAPVEHIPYLEILSRNSIGIALGVVSAVVGAETGRWIYDRRINATSSAA